MKRISYVAMFLTMILVGTDAWALSQKDGVYQITSAQDLVDFSALVNGGQQTANAVLTADIDLSGIENFTPIGYHNDLTGVSTDYQGSFDGKGHVITGLSVKVTDGQEAGLFGRVSTGQVKNLGIVNATIVNTANIRAGVFDGNIVLGTVTNCFSVGEIVIETPHSQKGGLSGEAAATTPTNCYTTYATLTNSTVPTNCYWNVADIASTGELCYKLNEGAGKTIFYQTIGTDAYPVLDSAHGVVYTTGERRCDGKVIGTGTYTNDENEQSAIPDHQYVNGVCSVCGAKLDDIIVLDEDGYYNIGNASQLESFAKVVNDGDVVAKARLIADIDLSGIENFTPIGRFSDNAAYGQISYGGIFDGQGHVISNLKISLSEPVEGGLFSRIIGGEVKNLGIVNASVTSLAAIRVGVLAGEAAICKLTNVYTAGEIKLETASTQHGGIAGEASGATLTNCFTTYATLTNSGSTGNCYADVSAIAPTGELCYKLNDGAGKTIFYQTLGTDEYPTLDTTHGIVNQIGATGYATQYIPGIAVQIPSGVSVFTGFIDTPWIALSPLSGIIPAGEAVVLQGAEGYYSFVPTIATSALGNNELKGTAEPLTATGAESVLAEKDGVVGFYKAEGTIPAGKAYIEYAGAGVKAFFFGDATGLTQTLSQGEGEPAAVYDLSGRRVEKPGKGIYIVNGKLRIMK
ncbi:MAG: hypothetical protein IJ253_07165 [Bacteroidaceae bacterium]|nr:hypothetical protein [Bacteroidaceae bacterium]